MSILHSFVHFKTLPYNVWCIGSYCDLHEWLKQFVIQLSCMKNIAQLASFPDCTP